MSITTCLLRGCDGLLHNDGSCFVDLAAEQLGEQRMVSSIALAVDSDRKPDLDVYIDARATLSDPVAAVSLASKLRKFADALDLGARLLPTANTEGGIAAAELEMAL